MRIQLKNLVNYGFLTFICVSMAYLLYPFLISMIIGGIFAIVSFPIFMKLMKFKWSRWLSSFCIVTAFSIVFLGPIIFFIVIGSKAVIKFIQEKLVVFKEDRRIFSFETIENFFEALGITDVALFDQTIKVVSNFLIEGFQGLFKSLPFIGLSLFIALFTMFFCLAESGNIKMATRKYLLFSESKYKKLSEAFRRSSHVVVVSNILGALSQSTITSLGALITGTGNVFLIGFSTFLISFVPVIGTAPITLGLATKFFLSGEIGKGIGWLVIGALTGVSDGFVKTIIIHEAIKVHPYIGFLSVLGGLIAFGIPGLLIGPLIAAVFTTCVPILLSER